MPYWPIVRGREVIAFGRVVDARTGEPMPPGDLPETWCQTESFIAWSAATGVALRARGSRDVVALELGPELRSCATTPAGSVIATRDDETRITLLGPDLRPRWTVPTPSHADVCNALIDGAIAQRVTDEPEPDRWLRFDPETGATLDRRHAACDSD